ncbi:hypothetical protein LCGC14_3132640, partial [marine sediment metagenome]
KEHIQFLNQLRELVNNKYYGKIVYVSISGSDLYGFRSKDSDTDYRGSFQVKTNMLLGIKTPGETIEFETFRKNGEVDDEAGSGVTTYNGSTFCAKIHTATGNFSSIRLLGVNLDAAFTVGDWYELSYDYKTLDCTYAKLRVMRVAGEIFLTNLTSIVWTTSKIVFQLTVDHDMRIDIFPHYSSTETGNEVVWIDNISIKRIGKVAHYKFNGNYLDEGSNNNDLTAGGTGNVFLGYTLKKCKIISPYLI